MRVDTEGHASPFGRMIALHGGGFWVDEADGLSEQHDGLPWFLDDMRPQGFIGRSFAHSHPELQLGGDPRQWGEEDRKSTRLNSSHLVISYAVFCLKKKN